MVADYRVYGMKVSALEHLLHRLFAEVRLDIAALVPVTERKKQAPSEWFLVPLEIINQAIDLIASGDIVNYRYEKAVEQLVEW